MQEVKQKTKIKKKNESKGQIKREESANWN